MVGVRVRVGNGMGVNVRVGGSVFVFRGSGEAEGGIGLFTTWGREVGATAVPVGEAWFWFFKILKGRMAPPMTIKSEIIPAINGHFGFSDRLNCRS